MSATGIGQDSGALYGLVIGGPHDGERHTSPDVPVLVLQKLICQDVATPIAPWEREPVSTVQVQYHTYRFESFYADGVTFGVWRHESLTVCEAIATLFDEYRQAPSTHVEMPSQVEFYIDYLARTDNSGMLGPKVSKWLKKVRGEKPK